MVEAPVVSHSLRKLQQLIKIKEGLKSVNLQYNTLVRWADGTNDPSTKGLMFQVLFIFFIISCKILAKIP